jgi:hypothetical protein
MYHRSTTACNIRVHATIGRVSVTFGRVPGTIGRVPVTVGSSRGQIVVEYHICLMPYRAGPSARTEA